MAVGRQIRVLAGCALSGVSAVSFAAGPPLGDHEGMENVVGSATSEHFAVKWGPELPVDEAQAADLLATLEEGYALQIETLGLPTPRELESARLNVYVLDSGVFHPSWQQPLTSYEPWPYTAADPDGWWFATMPPPPWTDDQRLLGAFALQLVSQQTGPTWVEDPWWPAGLATWVIQEQRPDALAAWGTVQPLLSVPENAPDRTAFGNDVELLGRQPFGAMALLATVSGEYDRPDLVAELRVDPGEHSRLMPRLRELLEREGIELGEVVTTMWAGLVARDLAGGGSSIAIAAEGVATSDGFVLDLPPEWDHRITMEVEPDGAWASPPRDRRPQRYGANVVRVTDPGPEVEVGLAGAPFGAVAVPARWRVAAVTCAGATCERQLLAPGTDTWTLDTRGVEVLDLVVVPLSTEIDPWDTFDYAIRVSAPAEGGAAGCGCAPSPRPVAPLALVLAAALVARRRRSS